MSPVTTNYTQGYSKATTSSHASRTVQSDAGFLIPHIKPTDKILDVGCGPGSITAGIAALIPNGSIIGIDISDEILAQAREAVSPRAGTNISFQKADLLAGLPFPADSFDIVFSSQLFPHLPSQDMRLQALTEMRRVLKPGGILATRDAAELHYYPRSYRLDQIGAGNAAKALRDGKVGEEGWYPGGEMPALVRRVGFEAANVSIGAGVTVHSGSAARQWLAERSIEKLSTNDPYRESWKRAGITDEEIEETREVLRQWAADEDAWYVALQAEILATK